MPGKGRPHPKCPVTRSLFHELAKPVKVTVDGVAYEAKPREFKNRSLGWMLFRNIHKELGVGGMEVEVVMQFQMIVVKSKEALP